MNRRIKIILILFLAILSVAGFVFPVFATETHGTIDGTKKYVWASKIGWINFGATNSNVLITDSALTGYVWNEHYGWINLSPTNSGVVNDNEGNLSGSAWGESVGWIDFSGVVINSSGNFTGTATGDRVGTVNFDCTNCNVLTDWRSASVRSLSAIGTGDGGSSAGPTPSIYSILINDNNEQTNSLTVNLKLIGDSNTSYVWISEKSNLIPVSRVNYIKDQNYTVYTFDLTGDEGIKTIYAQFCNLQGHCGAVVSDTINYKKLSVLDKEKDVVVDQPKDDQEDVSVIDKTDDTTTVTQKITGKLKQIASKIDFLIPDFLKVWKTQDETIKIEDVKKFVSITTPLAMNFKWNLLPPEAIKQYVFAPLPLEYRALAVKIPSINSLFNETNINKFNDLRKLTNTEIQLPSLSKLIGLQIDNKQSEKQLVIEELSTDLKQKIPTGMVFARGSNQLVDFSTLLSMSVDGRPIQKLRTVSGKKLHLSVKPEYEAKSVKGYLTFVSRGQQLSVKGGIIGWLEKLNLINSANAIEIEDKMILAQFDYTDTDKDGIYTAEVFSPVPQGQYEILTVIEYIDSQHGNKLIRLVTVVDPEGYVFEKVKGKELRISNALVGLYWLNPQTKKYELWPAKKWQQTNAQITDKQGSYSFLVPPGSYYLQAKAPGYSQYQSAPFRVEEGLGVHMNIELNSKSWWVAFWDYKTWIIILLSAILLYFLEHELKNKFKKH